MTGPLAGVKVIDLTTVLMGPFATQLLGDMGADVIKVEPPEGDVTRYVGPARHKGMGGPFLIHNRNKRSIVLDLKSKQGVEALLKLIATADIFIFNLRPKAMARFGLSYETIAQVNPRIIYCCLCGFGQAGRYADKPAYDDLIQAAVGIPWLQEQQGAGVRYAPEALADRIGALTAVQAVTSALYSRERTGRGQAIEVPMFEVMAQFVLADHLWGHVFDPPIAELGYNRQISKQRRPFRTSDGLISLMAYTDRHCKRLFELIGRADLQDDPRFLGVTRRTQNIDAFYQICEAALCTRSSAEWLALFERADIPAMQVNSLRTLVDDPHLEDVGLFEIVEHASEGRLRAVRSPVTWSSTMPSNRLPAPTLGQHTAEILAEVGITQS
jgi:crotonobetainyl-CoA:carnitine CoA-transferase CaiB-like acyl-CoA transferase